MLQYASASASIREELVTNQLLGSVKGCVF